MSRRRDITHLYVIPTLFEILRLKFNALKYKTLYSLGSYYSLSFRSFRKERLEFAQLELGW